MKTKVKLISGDRITKIEDEINLFIEEKQIEIIDLKIAIASHIMCCSIVYREER